MTPAIGHVYHGNPVPAIVRETRAHGWPHPPTRAERRGLEFSLGLIIQPGIPAWRTACQPVSNRTAARWLCLAGKPSGYGVATRVRAFEDGSFLATVYAVLGPVR